MISCCVEERRINSCMRSDLERGDALAQDKHKGENAVRSQETGRQATTAGAAAALRSGGIRISRVHVSSLEGK